MRLQHILAATDFSRPAEQALDRAALLAAEHGAALELVFVGDQGRGQPTGPAERLAQRARQLARRHRLPHVQALPLPAAGAGRARAVLDAAGQADLVVLDGDARAADRGLRPLRQLVALLQLLRAARCPVLLVRRPAERPYAHVLVDARHDAGGALLRCAGGLQPRAALELFHAAQPRGLRCRAAFERALRHPPAVPHAALRELYVSDAFDARRNRVDLALRGADAVRQLAVQQHSVAADLVALAHRPRHPLLEGLRPGAVPRLLAGEAAVACDVLVLPSAGRVGRPAPVPARGPAQSAVARRWTQAT